MVGRLLPRLGAQLGGAALGGLEDQPDLLRGAAGQRERRRVDARLELVGDAAEMLVDRGRVIATTTRRKIPAFDPIPIHDCLRIGRAPKRHAGYGRYADPSGPRTTSPSRSSPASARSRRSPCTGSSSPASNAATIRPRAQRSVSSKRTPPRRRAGKGSGPPHPADTGQEPQSGARGRQTVAPSSIIAWLNVAARPSGSSSAARAASARGVRTHPVPSRQHAAHVRVHGRDLLIPGERPDRRRRVRTDAGQHRQVSRPPARRNLTASVLERQSAPVVAEPAPELEHVARRRVSKRPHRRKPHEPALVVRHDPERLRLLEHHLRDEQRVRIARLPPRQRPPHPLVPLQQRLDVHAGRISALATKCVARASRSVNESTWIQALSAPPGTSKRPASSIGPGPDGSR